jgi:hypothetical protein
MSYNRERAELAGALLGILIVSCLAAGAVWIAATLEANAFNRFTTGPKATTWDALFVELRVDATQK